MSTKSDCKISPIKDWLKCGFFKPRSSKPEEKADAQSQHLKNIHYATFAAHLISLPEELILRIFKFIPELNRALFCIQNPKLKRLHFDPCLITTITSSSHLFTHLNNGASGSYLLKLNISGASIGNLDCGYISERCKNLRNINLSNNPKIGNEGFEHFCKNCPNLATVISSAFFIPKVGYNSEVFKHLVTLTKLVNLNISWGKGRILGQDLVDFISSSNSTHLVEVDGRASDSIEVARNADLFRDLPVTNGKVYYEGREYHSDRRLVYVKSLMGRPVRLLV